MARRQETEDLPSFEGNTENLLRSGRLRSLYDSDKWELGRARLDKGRGHDDRAKDHRR
jgi:hypothetical protein